MPEQRMTGVVRKVFADTSNGYVQPDSGGERVFFSGYDIKRAGLADIHEGDRLSFVVTKNEKGLRAVGLQRAAGEVKPAAVEFPLPSQKRQNTHTDFRFGPTYLKDGYFEERSGKKYLRSELLDALANDIACLLGSPNANKQKMKASQMRRFFNQVRAMQFRLERQKSDFNAIRNDLVALRTAVYYQAGRGVATDEFVDFIALNVQEAIKDEASFRQGFIRHFESVLAFFVFHFQENERNR